MDASPTPNRPTGPKPSPLLIGGGILVIALGFGLPRLFTGSSTDSVSPPPASAAAPGTAIAPAEGPSLGMALGRLAVSLGVVAGLCVVVARVVGRRAGEKPGNMAVVASLAVGPRCAVHLVRSGDRRLLIGTDATGVKALVELPARVTEPGTAAADRDVIAAILARSRAG